MAVGGGARARRRRERGLARSGRGLEVRLLLVARVHEDVAGAAVDGDDRPFGQLTGTRQRDNSRHPQRPRQNRAVAGRAALLRDEAENQCRVQQRRVGRGEVAGDEDVGLVAVRDTRHRDPEQTSDDTIPHVIQVGDPSGKVLAGTGQQLAVRGEGVVDGALGRASDSDTAVHVRHELGVLGHHGLSFEHGLGFAPRQIASRYEVGCHRLHSLASAPLLTLRVLGRNLLGRRFEDRRSHVPYLADRHTVAHTDASQRCLHLTRLR